MGSSPAPCRWRWRWPPRAAISATLIAVTGPLIGWAFIGTGIFAWLRQPENRFGALMTAVGFSACLAGLRVSTEPWVFIFGLLFITSQWALLYHMLLAFPARPPAEPVRATAGRRHVLQLLVCTRCRCSSGHGAARASPTTRCSIEGRPDLAADLSRARFWFGLVLLAGLGVILARRWGEARARSGARSRRCW